MKKSWELYYYKCEMIINGLLDSIAHILNLNESFFHLKTNNHSSALRATNYFILNENNYDTHDINIIRCSEHSDWGTLTLLRQDHIGGLQIEIIDHNNNKIWIDVISDFYDFVVNVGDLMQRWTNDRFKSTRHRVVTNINNINNINKNTTIDLKYKRRQSMAFFHLINDNAIIETIPSCLETDIATNKKKQSKYKPITAWKYLETKHLSTQVSD